jgi:hypothetical protein
MGVMYGKQQMDTKLWLDNFEVKYECRKICVYGEGNIKMGRVYVYRCDL